MLSAAAADIGPAVDPSGWVATSRGRPTAPSARCRSRPTDDPDLAALKANTVAEETVAFLVDRETARQEASTSELDAQETSLRERIAALDAVIANNPPDVDTITAERDALIRQLGEVLEAQDADACRCVTRSVDGRNGARSRSARRGRGPAPSGWRSPASSRSVLGFGLAIMLDRSDTRLRTRAAPRSTSACP